MTSSAAAAPALDLSVSAAPGIEATTTFHARVIDGVEVAWREAGPHDAPTLLLLHGFPSSSAQFATLIPRLADRYHVVAPEYPGFGRSAAPPPREFAYTFDHLAEIVGKLTEALGVTRYVLVMNDYGGPVGFRLAEMHPERVAAMIVQNAVAHEDGLGPLWEARKAYWRDRATHEAEVMSAFLSPEVTRDRHIGRSPRPERYDPSAWIEEARHLAQPGQREIQADLFYDYRTNVAAYPRWQAWLAAQQPPLLVVWGKYDPSFQTGEATAYLRDVPEAEVHILNAGHFALDEAVDDIAALMRRFLARNDLD